tara:strand:+ start:380 stop:958 length:579 start_codon:yes stop_codon:yes gene_type:complete
MKQINFPMQTFFAGGYIDKKLCDEIIQLHKTWRHRCHSGPVANGDISFVDKKTKDSIDLNLNKYPDMMTKYNLELAKIVKIYRRKYKYIDKMDQFNNAQEYTNIQYYRPGGGFKKWHAERHGPATSRRELVFMTYLNDVPKGGTDFYYFPELNLQAKKGLTIIWPSDWTHTHKGVVSDTHEKYIVTGWFNFI